MLSPLKYFSVGTLNKHRKVDLEEKKYCFVLGKVTIFWRVHCPQRKFFYDLSCWDMPCVLLVGDVHVSWRTSVLRDCKVHIPKRETLYGNSFFTAVLCTCVIWWGSSQLRSIHSKHRTESSFPAVSRRQRNQSGFLIDVCVPSPRNLSVPLHLFL